MAGGRLVVGAFGDDACPDVVVSRAVLDACYYGAEGVGGSVASPAAVDVDFHGVDHFVCTGSLGGVVSRMRGCGR